MSYEGDSLLDLKLYEREGSTEGQKLRNLGAAGVQGTGSTEGTATTTLAAGEAATLATGSGVPEGEAAAPDTGAAPATGSGVTEEMEEPQEKWRKAQATDMEGGGGGQVGRPKTGATHSRLGKNNDTLYMGDDDIIYVRMVSKQYPGKEEDDQRLKDIEDYIENDVWEIEGEGDDQMTTRITREDLDTVLVLCTSDL